MIGITTQLLAGLLTLAPSPQATPDISGLDPDTFYGATYYQTALEHPDVQKLKASRRLRAVARDIGWKRKKLKAAIAVLAAVEGDPVALAQSAARAALEASPRLKGRVLDVSVNAEEPRHVVVYVRWRGSKLKAAIKEASTIARAVHDAVPFVSTLSLAAIGPKAAAKPAAKPVWSAKISRSRMATINPKRIEDYADRMYARLFESVESSPY